MDIEQNVNHSRLQDNQWVELAQQGNQEAFRALYNKYRQDIYYVHLRFSGNENDSEDLTNETFCKAFASLHTYSPLYPFRVWLHKIATNTAIDFFRRQKEKPLSLDKVAEQDFELSDSNPTPEQQLIKEQSVLITREFVAKLKPIYRKIIELHYFCCLPYEEIAILLNLPLGTVKTQIFRAKEQLRQKMGQRET